VFGGEREETGYPAYEQAFGFSASLSSFDMWRIAYYVKEVGKAKWSSSDEVVKLNN
jgi:hypothetical protein